MLPEGSVLPGAVAAGALFSGAVSGISAEALLSTSSLGA
jgi:hypothetical protein